MRVPVLNVASVIDIDRGLVKGVARAPEIAEEDMGIMFQTNVTGLINMTQAVLPIFLARPNGGQGDIINIGSIAGTSSSMELTAAYIGHRLTVRYRPRAVPRRRHLLRHQGRHS